MKKLQQLKKLKNFFKNNRKISVVLMLFFAGLIIFIISLSLFVYKTSDDKSTSSQDNNVSQNETTDSTNTNGDQENTTTEENIESNSDETSQESTTSEGSEDTTQNGGSTPSPLPNPTPTPEPVPEPEPTPEPVPDTITATVAFYADNQSDTDAEDVIHQKTVTNILNSGANPVFHAGDLMEDGTQDSLNRFNAVTSTLRSSRAFYPALGNNDRVVGDSSTPSPLWFNNFSLPNNERWYSVNYGNLHLVVLDSAFASGSATQLSWLAADLQSAASQDRITGVMYHHPTFSSTVNSYLVSYGVDFVVAGHNHSYAHSTSNGIHYFTLSGQPSLGHMIGKIYHDKVIMNVYNNGNGLIQSVEFNER